MFFLMHRFLLLLLLLLIFSIFSIFFFFFIHSMPSPQTSLFSELLSRFLFSSIFSLSSLSQHSFIFTTTSFQPLEKEEGEREGERGGEREGEGETKCFLYFERERVTVRVCGVGSGLVLFYCCQEIQNVVERFVLIYICISLYICVCVRVDVVAKKNIQFLNHQND